MSLRTLDVASRRMGDLLDQRRRRPAAAAGARPLRATAAARCEGPDTDAGRPIIARYIWSDIAPDSARWTQAFSYDEGRTWEDQLGDGLHAGAGMNGRPDRRTLIAGAGALALVPAAQAKAIAMIVSPVVELRQYTLHPGRRDELIALFDREFVETQEAVGVTVIGQFRDLDAPDRYVWLRGFADMAARKSALEAFYFGPVWQAHREAANATIIDSDNVLLLKPLPGTAGFQLGGRRPVGSEGAGGGVVLAVVHRVSGADDPLVARFQNQIAPRLAKAGSSPVAAFVTETSANTFPRLPVREGEQVLVWLAILPDAAALDAALTQAQSDPDLEGLFASVLQVLRLQPTARSRLHG